MKTSELFGKGTVLSFEIFPPKPTADEKVIYETLDGLSGLNPDFISVTYGAGGGNNCRKTVRIASDIKHKYGIESIAHLPCINLSENDAVCILNQLKENEIENILALRGDISPDIKPNGRFHHANELIRFIYERYDFNIIAACYPEGHPESKNIVADIENLKRKADAGASQLVTQLFLDNDYFYSFQERVALAGINLPIEAGIMPVTNKKQIERMVKLCGVPESQVEDTLKDLIDGQTNPTIATYAKTGEVHIRVTASGENAKAAGKTIKPIVKELKSRFGGDIYSTREETTLEMAVADLLLANDLTVTTAESCTGGMIAARIINVPGVSECYKAGLVTYSNKAKRKFLGVRKSTLDKYGAVSSKTAGEMAKGAALLLKADVAVAVTGIAGPDGGTEEKPVGLVYIGCCVKGELTVKEYHFSGTRSQIREATTSAALILMRSCILKYFSKVTFGKK